MTSSVFPFPVSYHSQRTGLREPGSWKLLSETLLCVAKVIQTGYMKGGLKTPIPESLLDWLLSLTCE